MYEVGEMGEALDDWDYKSCQDCGMNEFGGESFGMWEASPRCPHMLKVLGMVDNSWRPKGVILVWEDEEV